MPSIEKIAEHTIYESPKSQDPPLNARFPGVVQLPSGELLAIYELAKTVDKTVAHTFISRSSDLGKTWQFQGPLYDEKDLGLDCQYNETLKPTLLKDGSLAAFGYQFYRPDLSVPICNPETGGFLDGPNVILFSKDDGQTWTIPETIDRGCPEVLETTGGLVQLRSGDLIASGVAQRLWDGSNPTGEVGVLLRSKDAGKTWSNHERFYIDKVKSTIPFESRMAELRDGNIISINWSYSMTKNIHLPNHVTISHDDGHTWSDPIDTGHMGQASNVMWVEGDILMSIHAHRAGDVGLYVRLVDFSNDTWNVLEEQVIWGKARSQDTSKNIAGQFADLQFGQPSLLRLNNDDILATLWCLEEGLCKIKTHRLRLNM